MHPFATARPAGARAPLKASFRYVFRLASAQDVYGLRSPYDLAIFIQMKEDVPRRSRYYRARLYTRGVHQLSRRKLVFEDIEISDLPTMI